MPNAFAHQSKCHAKNIPFFFKICKKTNLIPKDLKEPSHAQNLEIVARLFGYTDFHQATNDLNKSPKFNGESKILIEVVEKLNPEIDFSYEVDALRALKAIVKTIGVAISDDVLELGRYSILMDDYPAKWAKIAESYFPYQLTIDKGGLWKAVAWNVLFNSLKDYPNFNDVQADCIVPLNNFTAFKPKDHSDNMRLNSVLKYLLPMCVYNVYDTKETAFAFADYVDSQAMFFDICYGTEFVVKGGYFTDPQEQRNEFRRKLRNHHRHLNDWGNSGFSKSIEVKLYEFFNPSELLQIKELCAVYSYALKVFLNLRSDMPVFSDYMFFDEYGSLSVNQSLWCEFSVNEAHASEDHDFDYSYLEDLCEIENPSSMNYIIYKIIEEMSADLNVLVRHQDKISHQFEMAYNYLHESMDICYLFNDEVEPKGFNDAQEFLGRHFLFSHFKPTIVMGHFKRYDLVNDFPI